MSLPEFREDGWPPEGHYGTSWEEVADRFGGPPGSRRERLLQVLLSWRDEAREKGISGLLLLNGSFISSKEEPGDFDALLVYDDHVVELRKNDIEVEGLLDYSRNKSRGFDLWIFSAALVRTAPEWAHLDLFNRDKETLKPKGVLEVVLC
jgi:hypothetical protein